MIPWSHVISLNRLSKESDILQIFTDDNKVHQFTSFSGWFETVWNLVNFLFKTLEGQATRKPNKIPTKGKSPRLPAKSSSTRSLSEERPFNTTNNPRYNFTISSKGKGAPLNSVEFESKNHADNWNGTENGENPTRYHSLSVETIYIGS